MGWTGTYKPKRQKLKDFFAEQFNFTKNGMTSSVIDCYSYFGEVYLAIERKKDNNREVFAMVCLIIHSEDDLYYNFSYKDMDETMHPYYYNCPERILNLLTPTDNQDALDWRKKCQEKIQKVKSHE